MKTLKQIDEELFQRFKKAFPLMPNNQIYSIIGMCKSFTEEWLTEKREGEKPKFRRDYTEAFIDELLAELNNTDKVTEK